MAETRDVVIIGGGHNGLVTAFYLAKAGFKPLVLERRTQPGGAAITEEFHPGFRCSTLAHSAGPVRTDVIRDMQLEKHGLKLITPEVSVASLSPDGRALTLYNDIRKSSQGIANFSQKDAAKYPEFEQSLGKMGKVIGKALTLAPPNIDNPSRGDLWGMLKTGRSIRNLGKKEGAATGVVLSNGEEITAKAVISNADPKRTLLRLVDPSHLSPDFVMKLRHYRMPGTVAKVNLALSGLPKFTALNGDGEALKGRIHIGPELDYLERAFDESKYGDFSKQPYLEVTIPSLTDPSLAPEGQHVMSIYVQYAPYKLKGSDWESERVPLGDTVVKTLAQYAPNLPELILTHQIITPQDLEDTYGLTGGHIFHGELSLDQFLTMRPLLDWARYRTPIRNLYLCGSGTHPGAGLTGGSGANAAREILKDLKK